jgi:hypothetical protein
MAKNTGRDYELLTQVLLNQIHQQKGVQNLTVEHDVKNLQGAILKHQIDVLVRFEADGVPHTVIVQCKDWDYTVKQEHLLTFSGVLADLSNLPGQVHGIFVTRKGYQAGAKALASAKGIILYTFRERTSKDIIIQRIIINITMNAPWSSQPTFELDQTWCEKECERLGIPCGTTVPIQIEGDERFVMLYNEDGTPRQSLYDFKQTLYPTVSGEVPRQTVVHQFTGPTYIASSSDSRFPLVRLASVTYEIAVSVDQHQTVVESEDIVAYIISDVLTGATATTDRELHFVAHFNSESPLYHLGDEKDEG